MSKPFFRTLSLLILCQLFTSDAFTQSINQIPRGDGSIVLQATNLPELIALAGKDTRPPYYKFLWIFGDGTFINGTRNQAVSHFYENDLNLRYAPINASSLIDAEVYLSDIYTGGTLPPADLISGGGPFIFPPTTIKTAIPTNTLTLQPQALPDSLHVDSANLIRIQLNHSVRPQDTLVAIVSFRNPKDFEFSGQVYLFFESVIEKSLIPGLETKVKDNTTTDAAAPSPPDFSEFGYNRSIIHYDNMSQIAAVNSNISHPQVRQHYRKMLGTDFFALQPGEEQNIFFEFTVDSSLWNFIGGRELGEVNFMAVLAGKSDENSDLPFDPNLFEKVDDQQLQSSGVQSLIEQNFIQVGWDTIPDSLLIQSSIDQVQFNHIIGVDHATSTIVKAHDPNSLQLYTCECPNDSSLQTLLCKVEFSNDGGAATNLIEVEIEIPAQLKFDDITDITDISHEPNTAGFALVLNKEKIGNTLKWTLPAILQPAVKAGFGDASTIGNIVFSIPIKRGIAPSNIDSLQACVTFNGLTAETECTLPAAPILVDATHQDNPLTVKMECQDKCKEQVIPPPPPNNWLWLICIIILLLILLLLMKLKFFKELFMKNTN